MGEVLGLPERAEAVAGSLIGGIDAVRERAAGAPRRRCVLLERIDPPFSAGHWGPEPVEIAGGVDPIGRRGSDSVAVPWDAVVEAAPEVLVLACCGYSVARARADFTDPAVPSWFRCASVPPRNAARCTWWTARGLLQPSRSGIADCIEILAEILHPERFQSQFPDRGVARVG